MHSCCLRCPISCKNTTGGATWMLVQSQVQINGVSHHLSLMKLHGEKIRAHSNRVTKHLSQRNLFRTVIVYLYVNP